MSKNKKWIILTSGDRSLKEISADLKKHGFSVKDELDAIGQITGEAAENFDAKAKNIKGISSITAAHDDIQIGDPGSEETW